MESKWNMPKPCLNRLPIYYRRLLEAIEQGTRYVSSLELGAAAGVPDVQVRKDLSYFAQNGRPGVGYEAQSLANLLETFLGLKTVKRAALVGVGNLGRALALYPGFPHYGLQIMALFDCDAQKFGLRIGELQVEPAGNLLPRIRQLDIQLGVIAVPARTAQEVANTLIEGGVYVLWNFAPCRLRVPEGTFVKNEDLAASLALLSHHLNQLD